MMPKTIKTLLITALYNNKSNHIIKLKYLTNNLERINHMGEIYQRNIDIDVDDDDNI